MITIIHGDDVTASRTYFTGLKSAAQNPISLNGNAITLTDMAQILEGGGLFSNPENILIEDFLLLKKGDASDKSIHEYLTTHHGNHKIYIWENKEVSKTILNTYKHADIKLFKLPQILFQFLDSITVGNSRNSLQLFQQAQQHTEVELLFFMIIRQFRLLLAVTSGAAIEETKRMTDWQRSKYVRIARQFSVDDLKTHYRALHTIDLKQKSGGLPYSLSSSIDFFLVGL